MPSVKSSSRAVLLLSSTVMTPSLPTLSNASAMRSPIARSCEEMVATSAISSLPATSRATSSRRSLMAATALSRPRLRSIGAPPAVTTLRPSRTMACASTVAVVVPSPATSLVLVATSLASWAPRFSYESSSSTSLAIVTPSLVIVGAPHFLSMTTLRPFGPSVTLTTSASALTPRSRLRRASSSNSRILAMVVAWFLRLSGGTDPPRGPGAAGADRVARPRGRRMRASPASAGARHRVSGASRTGDHLVTMASTSRAERMRYSWPSYLTSVPPYFE
jgi:hypothetical protein